MKQTLLPLVCVILAKSLSSQSDNAYVPYQSLLNVNPSFAGSNGHVRDQAYCNIPLSASPYSYNYVWNGLDMYLPGIKSGVGLVADYSNFNNLIKTASAAIVYSKYFTINSKLKIIPSLQAGYAMKEIKMSWLVSPVTFQPVPVNTWERAEYFNLSSGILVNYKNFYGGISALNQPFFNSYQKDKLGYASRPQYNVHASYNMHLSSKLLLHMYGQYSNELSDAQSTLSVNALLFKHFIYGIGCKTGDAFNMNAGFRANYFTCQLVCRRLVGALRPEKYIDIWQIMLSLNLRNQVERGLITHFESW